MDDEEDFLISQAYDLFESHNEILKSIDAVQEQENDQGLFEPHAKTEDAVQKHDNGQGSQETVGEFQSQSEGASCKSDDINYLEDLITLEDLIGPVKSICAADPKTPEDLITLEDLIGPVKSICAADPKTPEDLITLEDLIGPVKSICAADPKSPDNDATENNYDDLPEASIVATIVVIEIFRQSWRVIAEKQEILSDAVALVDIIFNRSWKIIKPRSRWRCPDPSSWAVNIIKKRRADGLPYVTSKKIRRAKVPKIVDCSKCTFKCTIIFTEDDRVSICRKYWSMDYTSKKNFLLGCIEIHQPKTKRLVRKRSTVRSNTKKYFLKINDSKHQVCQNFFCKTFCISPSVVNDAVKNRDDVGLYSVNEDPRGRRSPKNKTPLAKLQEVRDHIASFPTMESHYVRKHIKRRYLDCSLSINKMYRLYEEECEKKNSTPVSEGIYRKIFCTDFNFGFYVPKKDQCLLCTKYKRLDVEKRSEIEKEYEQHTKRKESCNNEKKKDKERAEKEETFISASFDLQAILQIPSGDIGLLYYTRKLTIYNLTIYQSAFPNDAFCFPWLETNGKKGSSEIGSILYYYLSQCIPKNVVEVSLFSDTCSGQNRNQYVAALLLWSVHNINNLKIIEHKFLESGHSYMEVDSMHSAIENAQKHTSVYSMTEWLNIFKRARSSKSHKKEAQKKPYNVKEMKFNEFKDLKKLASQLFINKRKNTEGANVEWLKIKRMRYVKGETKIYYNYDMSKSFYILDLSSNDIAQHNYVTRQKKLPMPQESKNILKGDLKQLYQANLPISVIKKADLIKLCTKEVIPEEYHGWYHNLKTDQDCKDLVPYEDIELSRDGDSDTEEIIQSSENSSDSISDVNEASEMEISGDEDEDEYLYSLA